MLTDRACTETIATAWRGAPLPTASPREAAGTSTSGPGSGCLKADPGVPYCAEAAAHAWPLAGHAHEPPNRRDAPGPAPARCHLSSTSPIEFGTHAPWCLLRSGHRMSIQNQRGRQIALEDSRFARPRKACPSRCPIEMATDPCPTCGSCRLNNHRPRTRRPAGIPQSRWARSPASSLCRSLRQRSVRSCPSRAGSRTRSRMYTPATPGHRCCPDNRWPR